MHPIDILFVLLPLALAGGIALYSRRYVRSVADFMAGGRGAGRYLLTAARSEQGSGGASYVILLQVFAVAGFTVEWWSQMTDVPISILVALSGYVIYRFRQTRALTLAQFLEMRYSRRFRLFAGGMAFVAGLVYFGLVPVLGARFVSYFIGLPPQVHIGPLAVQTPVLIMAVFLTLSATFTIVGGQVTILLTDCAQGMITLIFFIFINLGLLGWWLDWGTARQVLTSNPPGQSLVNPFGTSQTQDFSFTYVLIQMLLANYALLAWQSSHAFNSSARNPHESRMSAFLARWRWQVNALTIAVLSLCAVIYLRTPHGADMVDAALAKIPDPTLIKQMRMPIALSQLMPVGIKGALLAVCIMGTVSGDGIHLHSWGSIFIQDVVLPRRKKPMTLKEHLLYLRLAIVGVALWAFCFGTFVPMSDFLALWFPAAMSIFVAGAGCAIIGGLYWSRGTTAGAWAGMIGGSTLSLTGIVTHMYCTRHLGMKLPFNLQHVAFAAALGASTIYVVVSLLTCRQPHNLDKLLHRGAYAVAADQSAVVSHVPWWKRLMGIDENFTRGDQLTSGGIFVWSLAWIAVTVIGSLLYWWRPWSEQTWANFWLVAWIGLPVVLAVITMLWFTWGTVHDLRLFFRNLREEKVDLSDDGSVRH